MRPASARPARPTPSTIAVMVALPLVAAAQVTADRGGVLPGIDAERVVVPDGDLAGHALAVSEVSSRLEPAEALGRVERRWREQDGVEVLRAESGGWSVVSRRTPGGYETLPLRAAGRGGSEGLLTRWDDGHRGATSAADFRRLLPDDARAVRQLRSRDAGDAGAREAETLIGRLPHSIDEAERRIEHHLRRAGYVAVAAPGAQRALSWRHDRARFFQAPGVELLVTLHAQSQATAVVVYRVRAIP